MRQQRQIELLERVGASGDRFVGLHAAESMTNPSSAYTDEARFAREQKLLFREGVVYFAMSCELPTTELVRAAAMDCMATATSNGDGEIQGCSAR